MAKQASNNIINILMGKDPKNKIRLNIPNVIKKENKVKDVFKGINYEVKNIDERLPLFKD